ncbi:MAG: hypothetical protein DLM55_05125 [Acidimicrobiales bacterium]|nr:MAG: hypothetical protein DLM55_05125 [Acidimicrobiales bacterium]
MNMNSGTGLSDMMNGYQLTIKNGPAAGAATPITFTIAKAGKTVTTFDREQTQLIHFYLIRSDLTGFQHLHPSMDHNGQWSVRPQTVTPGRYRIFTQFIPHADAKNGQIVLSTSADVPGVGHDAATLLPAPTLSTQVDGYTVTIDTAPKAGALTPLTLRVNTNSGAPVTDLQPYLDTYAHVTAFHEGDLAFSHLHPEGEVKGSGGPNLKLAAELPEKGKYGLFIQFQTHGQLHTAHLTVTAE